MKRMATPSPQPLPQRERESMRGQFGVEKMRFAIGLREFSKKKGGAERYLVDLCKRMAAEGHEVHVYAEHQEGDDSEI
ncbi:MAG: glycosyltransferase family 4 protein, partial [Thermodesulfobacteriota bacterium]